MASGTGMRLRPSDQEGAKELPRFLDRFPDFGDPSPLDRLRRSEFGRLDRQGHTYVDYTGGGIYGESQVEKHAAFLTETVLGNPHSTNPTSALATAGVARCRRRVLEFFNDGDRLVLVVVARLSPTFRRQWPGGRGQTDGCEVLARRRVGG